MTALNNQKHSPYKWAHAPASAVAVGSKLKSSLVKRAEGRTRNKKDVHRSLPLLIQTNPQACIPPAILSASRAMCTLALCPYCARRLQSASRSPEQAPESGGRGGGGGRGASPRRRPGPGGSARRAPPPPGTWTGRRARDQVPGPAWGPVSSVGRAGLAAGGGALSPGPGRLGDTDSDGAPPLPGPTPGPASDCSAPAPAAPARRGQDPPGRRSPGPRSSPLPSPSRRESTRLPAGRTASDSPADSTRASNLLEHGFRQSHPVTVRRALPA